MIMRKEKGACAPFLASRCFGLQTKTRMMPANRIDQFFDWSTILFLAIQGT
jgi:hypothetical protein